MLTATGYFAADYGCRCVSAGYIANAAVDGIEIAHLELGGSVDVLGKRNLVLRGTSAGVWRSF